MNSNATIQRDDAKIKSDIVALLANSRTVNTHHTLNPLNMKRTGTFHMCPALAFL